MITRTEIREAEQPTRVRHTLDLDSIICAFRLTTTRTFAGVSGAGEALYDEEREVELLSMTLRFGTHPTDDAVLLMASELTEDRRAAIEEQIKRAILKGM